MKHEAKYGGNEGKHVGNCRLGISKPLTEPVFICWINRRNTKTIETKQGL